MKFFQHLLLLVFLFGISNKNIAQTDPVYPKKTLRYCFEPLLSQNSPALKFGFEYRFKENHSWNNELGYIFNLNGPSDELRKLNGVRLLSEYRFYFGKTRSSMFRNCYFAVAGRYIYWNSHRTNTFWRDSYSYQQRIDYRLQQHRIAVNVGIGIEPQLSDRVSLGFGLLLGRGARIQRNEGIPEDGEYIEPNWISTFRIMEEGDPLGYADVLLRINIGYKFR